MNKEGIELLNEYVTRNGCSLIDNVIESKTLQPVQQLGVMYSLIDKKTIISFDTGLGKTVLAVALLNLILNKDDKALFILKRETLDEMFRKIAFDLRKDLSIGFITNEEKVKYKNIIRGTASFHNVIVISSDSISDMDVNNYIYENRYKLKVVIVDEMHLFSNMESAESRLMSKIVSVSQYTYCLTATPFERDVQQLINTAYMLQPKILGGREPNSFGNLFRIFQDGEFKGYKNIATLKKVLKPIMFNCTREMLGIKNNIKCTQYIVKSHRDWSELNGNPLTLAAKGDLEGEPFYKLVYLINDYISRGLKGLVYINLNDNKRKVYNRLLDLGYSVGIVDGSVSVKSEREFTKQEFRDNNVDVLILNRVVSADLECDFVIFYELTQSYKQFIGRGNRSYEEQNLIVDFIIAGDTNEEKYFKEHVYDRTMMLGTICDKDVTELERIRRVE